MPQNNGNYKNIYIHQNLNRNEIREFLLQNADHNDRPNVNPGEDRGLLYFDTEVGRIIVWDGSNWKIVSYFDDRDLEGSENIKLQNIWGESETVSDLSEDEAKGLTGSQNVVQYFEDRPTLHIPGTWTYYTDEMKSVIFPTIFNDGMSGSYSTFYEPIVKNHLGQVIDCNYTITEKIVNSELKYRINFLDGKKMRLQQVSPDNPPTVSFYNYVGERLSLESINGSVDKFLFTGEDFSNDPNSTTEPTYDPNTGILGSGTVPMKGKYRRNLTGTGVRDVNGILSLSVNGQELFPRNHSSSNTHYYIYQDASVWYVSIDTGIDGTDWDNDDDGGISDDDLIQIIINIKI